MVVVADEDKVDRAEIARIARGSGELARTRPPAEPVGATGRIERRIRQDPPAVDLEQDGRTAEVRQPRARHAGSDEGSDATACCSAHSSASSATSTQLSAIGNRCGPGYSTISVTVSLL